METQPAPEQPASLGGKYSEAWLRGWEQYLRAFGGATQPDGSAANVPTLQRRYVEFVQNEGASAFRKLSELSLNYYSAVLDLSLGFTQEFYRQLFQNGARPAGPAAPANPPRELVFTGPPGSSPTKAFLVANNTDAPALMSFELSEFTSDDGEEKVRVEAELTPPAFELGPRGQRAVDCRLPLNGSFRAGRDYHAVLRVIGFPDMKVCLLARVEHGPDGEYSQDCL